ncbi:YncE family protein [Ferruginibacter sp. SUN106]|uniref:YncE family protein n=1 Tax=Ferruginibacter sp. SUN106 TaxID=2978348 RepID=UPI003D36CB04
MKKLTLIFSAMIIAITAINAQQGLHVLNTLHIASPGGWDYLEVGPVNDWLYVSHGTQVNILNKKTGDSVGVIENTTGVHGIAFDVAGKKGFTSNGRLNTVTVFDMNTNKVLAQIAAGQNPDAIIYEPFSKKIITCNGRGKNLSIIDPVLNKTIDSVDVGGKPETPVSDGMGKLFVNIEDKNEIVVIDTKTFKVLNHWSIAPGDGPTGLAFDKTTKRLFAGCEKLLMVIDATNGNIVDKITIGDGCDGVAFDAATKNIYTANGADGTMSVIHEESASKFVLVENVVTKKSARTITLDNQSHLIYLPAAELEPMEPGQKGRPKMKAGTFQVLVVGK